MRRLLVLIVLLLLALHGCVTPVIPLPPPKPETYKLGVDATNETITISGTEPGYRGAYLFILNQDALEPQESGTIVQVGAAGGFTSKAIKAKDGNRLYVWAARGVDDVTSDSACAKVDLSGSRLQNCF